nr:hypothetical protein [Nocardia sp. BMG51109]
MSWGPGQGTEPHDHGGASGAFTVTVGQLDEQYRHPGNAVRDARWRAGETRRLRPATGTLGAQPQPPPARPPRCTPTHHRCSPCGNTTRSTISRAYEFRGHMSTNDEPVLNVEQLLGRARAGLDRLDPRQAAESQASGALVVRYPAGIEPQGGGDDSGRAGDRTHRAGVAARPRGRPSAAGPDRRHRRGDRVQRGLRLQPRRRHGGGSSGWRGPPTWPAGSGPGRRRVFRSTAGAMPTAAIPRNTRCSSRIRARSASTEHPRDSSTPARFGHTREVRARRHSSTSRLLRSGYSGRARSLAKQWDSGSTSYGGKIGMRWYPLRR